MASSGEEFYDAEIAPKLLEIAKACEARGMSFVAMVEYAYGETGETHTLAPRASRSIKPEVAYWGVKCRGNVDAFNIAAARYSREHGHSSMVMQSFGIAVSREDAGTGG